MDTPGLIKRVKELCNYGSDAALAKGMGMSPQKFFAQKKAGTINNSLLLHGIEMGANREWLRTGQGEMLAKKGGDVPAETSPAEIIRLQGELIQALKENAVLKDEVARLKGPWDGKERRIYSVKTPPDAA